jgi:hypothetical protein
MEESSTYQWIVAQGQVKGQIQQTRNLILRLGTRRFGSPSPTAVATLEGLTNLARLEDLSLRLLDVASCELLAGV